MLSLRECILLDSRSAGARLIKSHPNDARKPGWLESALALVVGWLFSNDSRPDERDAARALFPFTAALHPGAIGKDRHVNEVTRALADGFLAGGKLPDPAPADADPHPAFPDGMPRKRFEC